MAFLVYKFFYLLFKSVWFYFLPFLSIMLSYYVPHSQNSEF